MKTHQRGMTAIGWLIVLGLIGFFVLLGLRMVPAYLEYHKVQSSLASLEKESGFSSPAEIRRLLERRFDVNYVTVITPKDIIIKPSGSNYRVAANYEHSEHVIGNVRVVMDFNKQVLVKRY